MTPTARALQQLRKDGWLPAVVERWNPGARVRQDLFGFLDIVAIGSQSGGVFGIQVTTGAHVADRLAKIKSEPVVARVRVWLAAGNALEVWGWSKQGPRGKRKTWTLRREPVWLSDIGVSSKGEDGVMRADPGLATERQGPTGRGTRRGTPPREIPWTDPAPQPPLTGPLPTTPG